MQLRGDSSSFVLELVGVCRTSEKGDECGIKVGALLLAPSYSKRFEPRPFPGNNICDTFPTGIWLDTTVQVRRVSERMGLCSTTLWHKPEISYV
jgi:hypothetical protein